MPLDPTSFLDQAPVIPVLTIEIPRTRWRSHERSWRAASPCSK